MGRIDTFFNGAFLPAGEAYLNIEDRGTIFGDGIYEVIRIYKGRLFQANEHLDRFFQSAAGIEIVPPYDRAELARLMNELVQKSGVEHGTLYMQLTRGVAKRTHNFPADCQPTFFMIAREAPPVPPEVYEKGVRVMLHPEERWKRCDIKSINLLPNVLAKEKALRLGYFDVIFYSEQGITEATSSSVLAVIDGVLTTAPQGCWVLPGITRDTVLRLAGEQGIEVSRRFIGKEELFAAEEVLLTSTRIDVVPVVEVDNKVIADGRPGQVFRRLKDAMEALLEKS